MEEKKRALKQAYAAKVASEDIEDGIYQIKNKVNGKVYVGSSRDISKLNGLTFQLKMGSFMNEQLQNEWNDYGESNFSIDILESYVRDDNVDSKKTT